MFTHIDLKLPKLSRESIDGVRYYNIGEENKKLVSITSVISHYSKEKFAKWRKRVGEEEANRITKRATSRGTDTHTLIESYLLNEELSEVQPISEMLFKLAKKDLNRINKINILEGALYSEVLGVAGTTDCIAEFDGELAVIDFKTSKAPKPLGWLEVILFKQCFMEWRYMR